MKFRIIYTFFTLILFSLIFMASKDGRAFDQGWGNTGAPGDETLGNNPRTCQSCHNTSSAIQVTIDIDVMDDTGTPISEYVPETVYDVKVTLNSSGNETPVAYGFQALCLKASLNVPGDDAAAFSNPAGNVRIATASNTGNRQYAEHKGPSSSNEFEFQWTAPEAGTGKVSFYTCGNGVNGNNSTNGDNAACTTLVLDENTVSTQNLSADIQFTVFPNPIKDVLHIQFDSSVSGNFEMNIYNKLGQLYETKNLDLIIGESALQFDVSQLISGTYILQLTDGEKMTNRKLLKL